MGLLQLKYRKATDSDGDDLSVLRRSEFRSFNTSVLGLGSISRDARYEEALAAMFDLEGFTTFCNQIDPQLVVPEFLESFLRWIFESISTEFEVERKRKDVVLWAPLPFFAKFMGDGVLFLWDTNNMKLTSIGNIVVSLLEICRAYQTDFLRNAKRVFVNPPPRLRCGIARGRVVSVGDGSDFVGSCINVAARLQKLSKLSFAFSRRGFDPKVCLNKVWRKDFVTRKVPIRGVGEDEIVVILKKELKSLGPKEASQFVRV